MKTAQCAACAENWSAALSIVRASYRVNYVDIAVMRRPPAFRDVQTADRYRCRALQSVRNALRRGRAAPLRQRSFYRASSSAWLSAPAFRRSDRRRSAHVPDPLAQRESHDNATLNSSCNDGRMHLSRIESLAPLIPLSTDALSIQLESNEHMAK